MSIRPLRKLWNWAGHLSTASWVLGLAALALEYVESHSKGRPFDITVLYACVMGASVMVLANYSVTLIRKLGAEKQDKRSESTPPPPMPLAGTPASKAWLYAPLQEVYNRIFQHEEVVLDGHHYIGCRFGEGVVFIFQGTAHFRLTDSRPDKGFTMNLKSSNLIVTQLIGFLRQTNTIGQGTPIFHPPSQ